MPDSFADVGIWLLVAATAVLLNAVPAFMPPTWALLAYFHLQRDLDIVPLAAVGAVSAASGRMVLALASRAFGMRFVPKGWRSNIETLAETIKGHRFLGLSSLALFAIGPIPTNHLFIAAGISRVSLPPILVVFGLARFVSYMIWVAVAGTATRSLGNLLTPSLGSGAAAVAQIVGFVALILVMRIDWSPVIHRWFPPKPNASIP